MLFSLETKSVSLSVGEFAAFSLGPREGGSGAGGLWRAQLGQHWHAELRKRAEQESLAGGPLADLDFEIPVVGRLVHRGWSFDLNGRIDQLAGGTVREIKTVTDPLPADEARLRADYPDYFLQAATYLILLKTAPAAAVGIDPATKAPPPRTAGSARRAELVFVEVSSGLSQAVPLTPFDEALVHHQLDALVAFLDERVRASARRRSLVYHSPFASLRPGQETIQADLATALGRGKYLLFEAPTGYGKTGCLLEFALGQLKSGRFARLIWLTGKATGQLQVVTTLQAMTAGPGHRDGGGGATPGDAAIAADAPLAVWQVRPKAEHCINHTYHCLRDACGYLAGGAERWPQSGLARFYLDEKHPRDLEVLRAAGRDARICPYEITRTALAFQDVWIGDYNYVFAPANRGIFNDQPGFDPAETLLVVDEAHNLPARVADAHSHHVRADDLRAAYDAIHLQRGFAHLALAWEKWTLFVARLKPSEQLDPLAEADLRDLLADLAPLVTASALDHAALGPPASAALWQAPLLADWLADTALTRLLWSPRAGELAFTCLDAAPAIGATLRTYGGAILMSATLSPADETAAACGLDEAPLPPPEKAGLPENDRLGELNKRATRRLFRQLTSGAGLLRVEEAAASSRPVFLRAPAPWRDGAYDVGLDLRVSTTLRERERHRGTTADTVAALHSAARGAVAVFFPSYAYAEAVLRALENLGHPLRVAVQPRLSDLAAQHAWMDENLALADALFLVLGGSFAEGIDLLGGRVTHAMVVGPALPEVNAVQRARLAAFERAGLGRDAAFRRVYQAPGLQKVNQALGRLVRAPGHRARVLLHCRRFAEPSYAALLAPEYQQGREIGSDAELREWLGPPPSGAR
ncbi:MAG TPA: helicase C-terminal domain-containing protein [Opitutaceae bacterium]|nr:helicase C-terminal domain-containing protein [Opitutaceae bacterium]